MSEFRTISARALIKQGDEILVEWFAPKGISFLPGGSVGPLEDIEHALIRELNEELDGALPVIKRYLGRIGHRWRSETGVDSCLNHFFEVELSDPSRACAREEGREIRWLSIRSSELETLQPPSLRRFVCAPLTEQEWSILDSEVEDGGV